MRTVLIPGTVFTLTLAIVFGVALPAALSAEVVIRPHDAKAAERPVRPEVASLGQPAEKADSPATYLYVPYFEVDLAHSTGQTTLFAVRNASDEYLGVRLMYYSEGVPVHEDPAALRPRETYTVNVRDVRGLPRNSEGFATGYVVVTIDSFTMPRVLVGDFFRVDPGNNFATGERMVGPNDFCSQVEVRFLDFGAGTELVILNSLALGDDPEASPATMTLRPFDEQGNPLPAKDIWTNQRVVSLHSSEITANRFGTLVIDFHYMSSGWVYAEYSAEDRYSVGVNGACTVPYSGW